MPTFESIHFCRGLANRLVAISDNNNNNNNNNNHGDQTAANTTLLPIDTPQALISRHPHSLRLTNEDGTVSTNPLHCNGFPELRREVAGKLVALSLAGQRHARMELVVQQQRHERQQEQQQDENDEPDFGSSASSSLLWSSSSVSSFPGTVTALDMLQYQKAITTTAAAATTTTRNAFIVLSTGALALDTLLGIPPEIATSISSSVPRSLSISTPVQGLPWGHVIHCTGPSASGKTQLALSVAASAAAQGCAVLYLASAVGHGSLRSLAQKFRHFAGGMALHRSHLTAMMDSVAFQVVDDGHQLLVGLAELEQQFLSVQSLDKPANDYRTNLNNTNSTNELSSSSLSTSPAVRVVILDSASGCLSTEDETLLQRVALRLKHLARHYHLVVWINNASMMPSSINQTSRNHQDRDSIGSVGTMEASPRHHTHGQNETTPTTLQRKVALGAAWNKRVADLHISLENIQRQTTSSDSGMTTRQSQEPSAPPNNETVIRATLRAHPFKKCQRGSVVTADISISARGIQDYSSHQVSRLASERE